MDRKDPSNRLVPWAFLGNHQFHHRHQGNIRILLLINRTFLQQLHVPVVFLEQAQACSPCSNLQEQLHNKLKINGFFYLRLRTAVTKTALFLKANFVAFTVFIKDDIIYKFSNFSQKIAEFYGLCLAVTTNKQ